MGREDDDGRGDLDRPADERPFSGQDRARKLRLLRKIGEALGRPIEDFFGDAPEPEGMTTGKPSAGERC